MPNNCCYGCKQRTSTCHDDCKTYLAEKEEHAKKRSWLKKKAFYGVTDSFQKNLERLGRRGQ